MLCMTDEGGLVDLGDDDRSRQGAAEGYNRLALCVMYIVDLVTESL